MMILFIKYENEWSFILMLIFSLIISFLTETIYLAADISHLAQILILIFSQNSTTDTGTCICLQINDIHFPHSNHANIINIQDTTA